MNKFMDAYNLRARLSPALLVLLPLLFGLVAWIPDARGVAEPLTGAAVAAGVLFILMHIARDVGEKAEAQLIEEWGGQLPSTLLLRHSDTTLDKVTKARYHVKLQATLPGAQMPTLIEEEQDPTSADQQYLSCCTYLLAKTRDDKKFPLIKEENTNYGFRRNLYGLRSYGFIFSAIGTLACLFKLYSSYHSGQSTNPWVVFCLIGCVFSLLVWWLIVSKAFVRSGAEAYARRLLEAIDQL